MKRRKHNRKMGKIYNHLSYEDRVKIEHWYTNGKSIRFMARELGRSPNTISYELKNLRVSGEYLAKKASVKAYQKRYLAAGEFGYAKDGTITAGDKVHALGKAVGQYVGLTALNICDQLPLWTPCDKKVNKININDHVINAFGPGVVAIGGLIGAGWGAWAATGGLLGLARNRYNNGAR